MTRSFLCIPAVLLASTWCRPCCLQLRRSFDALDQDHDGFITSADLLNLQQQLLGQHHMTKELAEDMMSEVSTCISDTHDGKMDFEEVRGRCCCCPRARTSVLDTLPAALTHSEPVMPEVRFLLHRPLHRLPLLNAAAPSCLSLALAAFLSPLSLCRSLCT